MTQSYETALLVSTGIVLTKPKDAPAGQTNRRNGTSGKVLKGQDGEMPIAVPRDRDGSFEPELVKKGQTRIDGMDDKIVGLYAAGLSVRDIRAHLEEVYGLKVSPDLISRVTDAVLDEVREWQSRALDRMYPIVIFDALRVKIRDADSRTVKNKAVYVALKRSAQNLNRWDSHTHDFVIQAVWEDGSCQHLCRTRFGRGFSDTLRKV
jgi:transposase-like protein